MRLALLSFVFSVFLLVAAEGAKTFQCFTCTPKPGNPKWCSRYESRGNYKKCKSDDPLIPANTCFKQIAKDGEVTKGCAPSKWNRDSVYKSDVGINNEPGMKTYFCNTKLCNGGNFVLPTFSVLASLLFLIPVLI